MKKQIEASCTWGDGPDVLVCSKGFTTFNLTPVRMEHSVYGCVDEWQLDLTEQEARELANSLLMAAAHVRHLIEATREVMAESKIEVTKWCAIEVEDEHGNKHVHREDFSAMK